MGILRRSLVVLLIFSFSCSSLLHAQQTAVDHIAPSITHTPSAAALTAGQPTVFAAAVTDDRGVESVTLFYRPVGASNYESLQMVQSPGTNLYKAVLPDAVVQPPGLDYYIQATDLAGNILLRGSSFSPFAAAVVRGVETGSGPTTVAVTKQPSVQAKASKKMSPLKWVMVAVGVGAIAALAGGGGGGSSSGPVGNDNIDPAAPTLTVTGPAPQ